MHHMCRLLAEFMQHSRSQAVAEAVEQLAGPVLLRMIHTQPGAYVGCAVFTHGTAKDRKKAVKAMKGACFIHSCDLVGREHLVVFAWADRPPPPHRGPAQPGLAAQRQRQPPAACSPVLPAWSELQCTSSQAW